MAKDFIIERLKEHFRERQSFSREELYSFYRQIEPDLKETTFRWRIHDLRSRQVITPISRGLFTLAYKPVFKPDIDNMERKICQSVEKHFPTLKLCIWSTRIISEFMLHFPAKSITILQVEKQAIEPVYDFLKEQKFGDIFIRPNEKEIERYIYESGNAIILQSLVSKSPIQKVTKVATTTLEKLIVDLFSDKKLFAAFQGNELAHIFNTAYSRYVIDFTTLFYYAQRRRKKTKLAEFLSNKTDIPNNILR